MTASEARGGSLFAPLAPRREASKRTIRLVTTARLREAAKTPLADPPRELVEGAAIACQIAAPRGLGGLSADKLVSGVLR